MAEVGAMGMFAQSTTKITSVANGTMGKSDFLKMLTTQMRYQDPLNPMDNTAMVAQMATFSQLEQMLNMTNAFVGMQASSMVGRTVFATSVDGSLLSGVVKSVSINNDVPVLTLEDGSLVALQDVQGVSGQSDPAMGLQTVAMLGRTITAKDANGVLFSGVVQAVNMNGTMPVLTLQDGTQVPLHDVLGASL